MLKTIRALRLFVRPLVRIAVALEQLNRLYVAELESKGVYLPPEKPIKDTVEVSYGYNPVKEDATLDRDWM